MTTVIKLQPKTHRPWRIHEVPVGSLCRNHARIGSADEGKYLIIGADDKGVCVATEWVSFADMLEYYTLDNREPCGTKL